MIKVECIKCGGKGNIKAFSGIDGGRCFSCAGKGYKMQKSASKILPKFCIGAMTKEGEFVNRVIWVKAKNEEQAIQKAKSQLACGNGYIPETAAVCRGE